MSIFGSQGPQPTRINQVQINQSVVGYPVPVVMGRAKLQQTIAWVDGYSSTKINASGGKGFGGKGDQYEYSADVIAALCNAGAGIVGIGDVWCGQSWLPNTDTTESFTVPSGADPTYTPINASDMTADGGAAFTGSSSTTVDDLGSPGSTTVSDSDPVALQRVPYTTTNALTTGQYSIDSNNAYHFSAADAGTAAQISYSFALGTIQQQENGIIPAGLTIQVGTNTVPFKGNVSVVWYDPEGADDGEVLQPVSGTPTASGTYYSAANGSNTCTYHFYSGDVNRMVRITWLGNNSNNLAAGTQKTLSFELLNGGAGQLPAAILQTNYPDAAVGYPGIALAVFTPMDLGYGAQIQQNTYEILTADAWGGGIPDCNPVQCILQVLSNPVWGLGNGKLPFPLSVIDNGYHGTWGTGNAGNTGNGAIGFVRPIGTPEPAKRYTGPNATSYFAANNFFISPVMDRQDTAASAISKWLEAGLCATFYSEGRMKLVPYGDTSASANGVTWTAPTSFVDELDDTDFIVKNKNDEPVKVSSSPWPDGFNKVQVQWNNRQNQYAPEITPESDEAAINRYGLRIEDPQSWDFITTLNAARFAASVRVKRNVYTRNKYTFTLSWRKAYLEPMDIVSITTNNAWSLASANTMQLIAQPVRITKTVDNPDGTIDITAEDYIFGAQQPSLNNKATNNANPAPNQFSDPGNTNVVMFFANARLTLGTQNQLWIGAVGANAAWGGCNVFVSRDGVTYQPAGTITTAARLGSTTAVLQQGSDPDTSDTLTVALSENCAPLESFTQADADAGVTLCMVGVPIANPNFEVVAYSACALTAEQTFSMGTYLRRGVMGTTPAAWPVGTPFLRLDDAIFKITFDPSWAGQRIYLKFQSFNSYGNSAQDLATVPEEIMTVPSSVTYTTVDAATGAISYVQGNFSGGIK